MGGRLTGVDLDGYATPPECSRCLHAFAAHGDRSAIACIGLRHEWETFVEGYLPRCGCSGYTTIEGAV